MSAIPEEVEVLVARIASNMPDGDMPTLTLRWESNGTRAEDNGLVLLSRVEQQMVGLRAAPSEEGRIKATVAGVLALHPSPSRLLPGAVFVVWLGSEACFQGPVSGPRVAPMARPALRGQKQPMATPKSRSFTSPCGVPRMFCGFTWRCTRRRCTRRRARRMSASR